MEPNLLIGDRLFASKYDYGYSKHSFPFSLGPISDRVLSRYPERGDVIIFKPPHTNLDYIKRLVGMPGDIIKVEDGKFIPVPVLYASPENWVSAQKNGYIRDVNGKKYAEFYNPNIINYAKGTLFGIKAVDTPGGD